MQENKLQNSLTHTRNILNICVDVYYFKKSKLFPK
jgi:hypothetical protein